MSSSLSIGIIGSRGIPNRYGGFERFAERLAPMLAERGHNVSVYCSHNQEYGAKEWKGVQLIFCYNPETRLGSFGQFLYDYYCLADASRREFDVLLHLGYTSDSVWSRLYNSKQLHVFNMDGMEWKRAKYSAPVRAFLRRAERRAARAAHLLIADSMVIREYLQANYPTPVRYISYGADIPSDFLTDVPAQYNVIPFAYDLIIARLEPENNIRTAIEAKVLSDDGMPLIIIGNHTVWSQTLSRKFSSPLIRFRPACFDGQVIDSLRYHSRYYLHGHSAGGTNPSLLEAMACKCRILAHDNGYNREVLEKGGQYWATAEDLAAMLRITPDTNSTTAESNLLRIREQYNWAKVCREYEEVFVGLLKR